MTPEQTSQFRTIRNGPLWTAVEAKMEDTITDMLRKSLNAKDEMESIQLLREARAAQTFSFNFSKDSGA